MSVLKMNPRNAVLLLIIVAMAILRIASFTGWGPLTVFTPIGAMALFGGAYFNGNLKPFAFPLLTLFISDIIVMNLFFSGSEYRSGLLYSGWVWTYLAFALMTIAGKLIIRDINVKNIAIAVVVSTLIHWLVSDIGGCLAENTLSFTVYQQRLITAIPYELRFLGGTAFFSVLLFSAFEILQKKYTVLKPAV
ncbi:DUF6580 family putative transport protein [Niastella sp. OAS944]|uniref:DUF6580 family putative transport protein n=1 Tax=Niastella sp. OAS944 TaxID=2664089 RepID=UPI00349A4F06|nr:hypothetical protein [Chitinophagaceae bacterium OAS944]